MKEINKEETNVIKVNLFHKEKVEARIIADAKDRAGFRQKLDTCIHPLGLKEHPGKSIVNITSGKIAPIM